MGSSGTPRSSRAAVPADAHSPGTWHPARGEFNLPRAGTAPGAWDACVLPPPCPLTLVHAAWPPARGSTGSGGLRGLGVGVAWARWRQHWQLLPGPSENCDRAGGGGQLAGPALTSQGTGTLRSRAHTPFVHGSGERAEVPVLVPSAVRGEGIPPSRRLGLHRGA